MLQFCDLDLIDQINLVMQNTRILPLDNLQHNGAILAHATYNPYKMKSAFYDLVLHPNVSDKLSQSILTVIQQDIFYKKYNLDTNRGFVLQKNGKNVFICNNSYGYDSTHVVVICLDEFENDLRIEYCFGEKVPNRWKLVYSGFAFGIICTLMDAANNITFPIL
jgi:hypothetical protein